MENEIEGKPSDTMAAGFARNGGFAPFSTLVMKFKSKLGITPSEFMLMQSVVSMQREFSRPKVVANKYLANHLGWSVRAVRLVKRSLQIKGLLRVVSEKDEKGSSQTSEWDFSPCYAKAKAMQDAKIDPRVTGGKRAKIEGRKETYKTPLRAGEGRINCSLPLGIKSTSPLGINCSPNVIVEASKNIKEQDLLPCSAKAELDLLSEKKARNAERGEVFLGVFVAVPEEKEESSAKEEKACGQLKLLEEDMCASRRDIADAAAASSMGHADKQVAINKEKRKQRYPEDEEVDKKTDKKPKKKAAGSREDYVLLRDTWNNSFKRAFPGMPLASEWGNTEFGMAKSLLRKYDLSTLDLLFRFVNEAWAGVNAVIFKGTAIAPTLSMVVKLHSRLVIMANTWKKIAVILQERDDFKREFPDEFLPYDLQNKMDSIAKDMVRLGLA